MTKEDLATAKRLWGLTHCLHWQRYKADEAVYATIMAEIHKLPGAYDTDEWLR